MIALILAGAAFLSLAMGFTGLPRALAQWIAAQDFSPDRPHRRTHRVLRRARVFS